MLGMFKMDDIESLFQRIITIYSSCEDYYLEIQKDIDSLKQYRQHLSEMSDRGFKVQIAVQRIDNQIQMKEIAYEVLIARKMDISSLFKKDLIELTRILVQYTPCIDSDSPDSATMLESIQEIENSDDHLDGIGRIKEISVERLNALIQDVEKFEPEITLAKEKKTLNYDIGDLVTTLEIQRSITQDKLQQYINFYNTTLNKHSTRAQNFFEELEQEKNEIL